MKGFLFKPLYRLPLGKKLFFAPSLIPTLAFFILLPCLFHLANWQFNRAAYKQTLLNTFKLNKSKPPLSLPALLKHTGSKKYLRLQTQGTYVNTHQFIIDNRVHKNKAGYHIITPVKIRGYKKWLLVNRGWIRANVADRRDLPQLKLITGQQKINGIVYLPPKKFFVLAKAQHKNAWPTVLQNPDLKDISTLLKHPVFPFIILLNPKAKHGFTRHWQPTTKLKAEKHTGYAFQWLALALTLVIIYIALNLRKRK